jgi:hypothetical protein
VETKIILTHNELCLYTAKWSITPSGAAWLALYEYQSSASQEFPDVLIYSLTGTILYEIKMSHADFVNDQKKEARMCRSSYSVWSGIHTEIKDLNDYNGRRENALYIDKKFSKRIEHINTYWQCMVNQDKTYQQAPHLGQKRYYVCESGIIDKIEVPTGWGLYYFTTTKRGRKVFTQIVESKKWKPDAMRERTLIAHALRRLGNGDKTGILIHEWSKNDTSGN